MQRIFSQFERLIDINYASCTAQKRRPENPNAFLINYATQIVLSCASCPPYIFCVNIRTVSIRVRDIGVCGNIAAAIRKP